MTALSMGVIVTTLGIGITHLLFYGKTGRIAAYFLGVLVLNCGATTTAFVLDNWLLGIVGWIMAGAGAFALLGCWWLRSQYENWTRRDAVADRILELSSGTTHKRDH